MAIKDWFVKSNSAKNQAQPLLTGASSQFSNSVLGGQQLGNLVLQIPKDQKNSSYQQSYVTVSGLTDAGRVVDIPLATRNATVMSCVNFKARTIGQLPIKVMFLDDDDKLVDATKKASTSVTDDYRKRARAIKYLLDSPNDYQSSVEFKQQLSMHLDLFGESFTVLMREDSSKINAIPLAMYNLEPSLMTTRVVGSGKPEYQISTGVTNLNLEPQSILQYWQCMHLMEAPFHGQDGFNKVTQQAELISLDQQLDMYCNYALENGAKLTGVVTYEKLIPEKRLQEIKDRLTNYFAKFGLGSAGAKSKPGQVALLDAGMQFQRLDMMTIMDAQAQALKEMTTKRICALFGVPPQLMGVAEGKFNNTQTLIDEYYKTTLCPLLMNIEQKLTQQLCRNYPRMFICFDTDPLLRGAPLDQAKYVAGLMGSVMTANECRNYLGMPSLDDPEADKLGNLAPKEIKGEGPQDTGSDERGQQQENQPKLRVAK